MADMPAVVKIVLKNEVVPVETLARAAIELLMIVKPMVVEVPKEVAVVAVMKQEVEAEVVEVKEMKEVVAVAEAAVMEAKVAVEEEILEAKVGSPRVKGATHYNYLKLDARSYLSHSFDQFQKNHFHPFGVQKHLPFQVHHPHPLRCNDAYHLE